VHAHHHPSRLLSIEAKYLDSTTEKAKSQQLLKQKESRRAERERRRHVAASQMTVISEGRELTVLSKSTNGLARIGNSKKLNFQKTKAPAMQEHEPPIMEGSNRKLQN
jgi:hypothetical protein